MRFSLNLSTRVHYNRQGLKLLLWIFTGLLLFLILFVTVRLISKRYENIRLAAEIIRLDQQLVGQSADVTQKEFKTQKDLIASINTLLERRASNRWIALLDSLESVVPDGVSLSKLEPEQKGNLLKLEGRAKNFNSIKKLLENLDKSKSFKEPMLLSHSDMVIRDRVQGFQFVISVSMVQL